MPGILYLVATPIGNLDDMTFRAVATLKNVGLVACEDTRRTDILLRHFAVSKPVMRYDEHTHEPAARKILDALMAGKDVAVVTDAGTPGISDPGSRLVRQAVAAGIRVVPIPGASAVAAAVSASGLASDGFVFLGFLPRRPGRARRLLQEALLLGKTLVTFESPFRVENALEMIAEVAPSAEVVVAKELTKIHEEFIRGSLAHVRDQMKKRPQKGEYVIVVAPPSETVPQET